MLYAHVSVLLLIIFALDSDATRLVMLMAQSIVSLLCGKNILEGKLIILFYRS